MFAPYKLPVRSSRGGTIPPPNPQFWANCFGDESPVWNCNQIHGDESPVWNCKAHLRGLNTGTYKRFIK